MGIAADLIFASNFDLSVTFLERKVTERTSKNKVCFLIAFIFYNGIAFQILIYRIVVKLNGASSSAPFGAAACLQFPCLGEGSGLTATNT